MERGMERVYSLSARQKTSGEREETHWSEDPMRLGQVSWRPTTLTHPQIAENSESVQRRYQCFVL